MAADNAFTRVKLAIPDQADAILAEYGVRHNHEGTKLKGTWTTGFLCPLCGDKSGSASFTHQLFLKCHQCAVKLDVFEWLSRHLRRKPWEVCKDLATRLRVDLPQASTKSPGRGRSMPARMTPALLAQAMVDLWDHKDAEPARAVLAERQLDDPQLLTQLEVGWIKGYIVFASRDERGTLFDRYRAWNPGNPKLKWLWMGQGSGGPGIWPCVPVTENPERVLLLEGESDVLTALARLRLHEQGWLVCTWTAGATSCPKPQDVPRIIHGKPLSIGYDNDVFQGPDYDGYYVEPKPGKNPAHARHAAEQRLRTLLNKVGPLFESLGCPVTVLQCPVDPRQKYGGDFRDWVDAGGRELSEWKQYPLGELPDFGKVVVDVPFAEVFGTMHKAIRTHVQVEAIARDDVVLCRLFKMLCDMGQSPACAICPGARQFPDGLIDMADFQRELAVGLEQQNVTDKIIKDVVQKPKGCPRLEVVPVDVHSGSEWKGMLPGNDSTQRSLHVFSPEPPSLSGEMEIEGIAYPNARGNGAVFLAEKVKALDRAEVDLTPVLQDLLRECPARSDRIEDIDAYFDRRARDLAFHVTKIHGRRDIHIAHDLLMHSVKRAALFGANQRAWLDICVYGDTRTGKSLTFRRMLDFHGLGVHHTAVSNMSRAGLLMGAGKDGLLKPGLMPRCNGKMLMIDEWHFMVQNSLNEHPMSWMQSARDEGIASGVKIYGNRDLPAAVRLVTIANWMQNKRRNFQFDCEHLGALYGAPETVARLDFGLAINCPPEQDTLDQVPQFWNKERTRTLILRAWAQEPGQVVIDTDAEELARDCCRDWQDRFDAERLPLFTPEEKPYSLLRIAIAVANAVFSHPINDPYSVHVRKVHVQWAANWLMHTWTTSGYDLFSSKHREAQQVVRPFDAERNLSVTLQLEDPEIAISRLSALLTPFGATEVMPLTGLNHELAPNWLARMLALHVVERVRATNGYNVRYQLTDGGRRLVGNLIRLAEEDYAGWVDRQGRMKAWAGAMMGGGRASEPELVPMTAAAWEIFGGNATADAVPF